MKKLLVLATIILFLQLNAHAALRTANTTGNWNSTGTWSGGIVPVAGDDVTINSGVTVTINVSPVNIVNVIVNGILRFDATGVARAWTVTGSFTIGATGSFTCAAPGSATTHTFNYNGTSFANNGTFNMANSTNVCNVTIGGTASQTINGNTLNCNKLVLNNTGGIFKIDYIGGSFTITETNPTRFGCSISTADSFVIRRGLAILGTVNGGTQTHTVANFRMGSGTSVFSSSVNVFTNVTTINVNTGMILSDATNENVTFTISGTFTSPNMAQANSGIAMALLGPNAQGGANSNTVFSVNGVTNIPDLIGIVGNTKLFGGTEPKRPDFIFNGSVTLQYLKSHTIDLPFTTSDFIIKTFFFGLFDSIGTGSRIILNGGSVVSPNLWNVVFDVFNAPVQFSSPLGMDTYAQISESSADWLINGNWKVPNSYSMTGHCDDTTNIQGSLRIESLGALAGSETETEETGYIPATGPLLVMGPVATLYVENFEGLGNGTLLESALNVAIKNRTADIDWNLSNISSGGTVDYSGSASQSVTARTYNQLKLNGGAVTKTLTGNTTVNDNLTIGSSVTLNNSGFNLSAKKAVENDGIHLGNGTMKLEGTTNQSLSGTGGEWGNMEINNSAGATCNAPVNSSGNFTLTNGILTTNSTNKISLGTNGAFFGGATSSYINGPAVKSTASSSLIILPLGKGGNFRPVNVIPSSSAATTWTGEYFNSSFNNTTSVLAPITSVNAFSYWTLDRTGTADANVKLQWNTTENLADLNGLTVARWDGVQWVDAGVIATTGTATAGTITSAVVSSFSPFTLGEFNLIAAGAIAGSSFCPGAAVMVPFTSAGTYGGGNIYTAQLSDASGSFTSPTGIGTLNSTANAGNISTVLGVTAGTGYRIRVVSSNPVVTGTDNGSNLSISSCAKPTNPVSSNITANSATLTWNAMNCAVKYKVQFRVLGTSQWTKVNATTNSKTITGLSSALTYQWRVQTLCTPTGSSKSGFTTIQTFATLQPRLPNVQATSLLDVTCYPNPGNGNFHVQLTGMNTNETLTLEVLNLLGEIVFKREFTSNEEKMILPIDISQLTASGLYLIQIRQAMRESFEMIVLE